MTKLYVLVGLPGSGKSTYAENELSKEAVVLSSDKIREELLKDAKRQDKNFLVFKILYDRAKKLLNAGQNVVVDATSINKFERKRVLINFVGLELEKIAIYFDTPVEECYTRDEKRERSVGRDVIDKFYKKFELPTEEEGFSKVVIIKM